MASITQVIMPTTDTIAVAQSKAALLGRNHQTTRATGTLATVPGAQG